MGNKWIESLKEVKKVSYVAAPMVGVTVLQYLLQLISMVIVGHLNDHLSLSAVSIATSFTIWDGWWIRNTIGQAYGAQQYQKLGTYTYTSIILLILLCFPISILWFFTDKFLILIGQDHSISHLAQNYSIALIPNLFSYAILQAFIRYFQTQSLIFPMLVSSFCVLCVHVPLSWFMVFRTGFGCVGAGLAIGLSYWINVVFLGFYIKCSSKCEKTRCGFSKDVFLSMKEMLRFSVPSAAMTCLEWWSYEVLILLSGLLPNPKVETSVLSICFTITYLHYFIPYGFGATVSTRVSNELGAGNPQAAKMAVSAILILALAEMAIMSSVLFACHRILGYAFSSDKEIVHNVAHMAPFLCLSVMMDSLQSVFSGIARGSGWQNVGGYVNLGAYYLVGTPVAVVLAFVTHLRVKGLLIGLATGSFVQASLLALRTIFTDWEKQAIKARERIFEGNT